MLCMCTSYMCTTLHGVHVRLTVPVHTYYMYIHVCMYLLGIYVLHVMYVCAHVSSSFLVVDTAGPRVYTYCT